jgi:TonB-dependent receptor
LRQQDTRFYQIGLNWKQELTDKARIELLAGTSKSDADIPLETTIALDDREATGFTYDYTNSRSPLIAFGSSVSDPANFQLAEIRDRPSNTTNTFRTLALKGEWDMNDQFQLQGGAVYRRFSFDVTEAARDTLVCPAKTTAAPDVVLGTINCTISSGNSTVFGPTAVYGFPVTTALTQLFNLGDSGQPAGTTSSFIIANLANAAGFTNLYGRAAIPNNSNIRGVVESDEGAFMQFNGKGELFGLRYAANGGVRYMKTKQSSTGINNGVTVEIAREYNDTLPSFNVALFPTEDFIVRLAASKVMTRPNLANLTPGGSVSGFLYTVSFGNPALDPFRAKAYDLSFEYYFAPESIFSVALFKKDVSSFPVSTTRSGTYASTGLPLSLILAGSPASSAPEGQPWAISTIGNGSGASLKGVEIAIQAPFKFLPGIWSNFGGIANATFVDSSAIYNVGVPAILPTPVTAALAIGSTATAATLFGLSRQAYNGTIYYEGKKFSARASWSYRSPFVDGTSATGNAFEGYNSSKNVDASVKYRINEMIELSLEGVNLTDDYRDRFTDLVANRNYEYNHFGRTFMAGVRVKL